MNIGDFPDDLLPYRWDFYLQPNTRAFSSPVTRTRQVLIGQGERYVGTGSWRFVGVDARRKSQRFEAMLDKLKGQANTINVWDFGHPNGRPAGPALDLSSITGVTIFTDGTTFTDSTGFSGGTGGYTVYGAHAIGDDTVIITGFPQNTTQLYAGDHVGLGGFLYRLTEDATANGLGRATLQLNRPLITAVSSGATVTTTRPRTPMQLLDDDQSRRSISVGVIREYTVSFIESLI